MTTKPIDAYDDDALLLALEATTDHVLAEVVTVIGRRPPKIVTAKLVGLFRHVLARGFAEDRMYAWSRPSTMRLIASTIDTCVKLGLRDALPEIGEYLSMRFAHEIRAAAAYALSQMPDRKYAAWVDACLAEPAISSTLRDRLTDAKAAIAALPEIP